MGGWGRPGCRAQPHGCWPALSAARTGAASASPPFPHLLFPSQDPEEGGARPCGRLFTGHRDGRAGRRGRRPARPTRRPPGPAPRCRRSRRRRHVGRRSPLFHGSHHTPRLPRRPQLPNRRRAARGLCWARALRTVRRGAQAAGHPPLQRLRSLRLRHGEGGEGGWLDGMARGVGVGRRVSRIQRAARPARAPGPPPGAMGGPPSHGHSPQSSSPSLTSLRTTTAPSLVPASAPATRATFCSSSSGCCWPAPML